MSWIIGALSYPFQVLFAAPVAWLTAIRALRAGSTALQAAVLAEILLLLMTIVGTLLKGFDSRSSDWGTVIFGYTLWMVGCAIVIPPLVYLAVKLWTEGPTPRHPDIERAWQDGNAALAREGLALAECPVFLVLGLRNERQVRAFMIATGLEYAVKGAPEGGSNPLYFYAIKDYRVRKDEAYNVIYLVLTDASQTSKLVSLAMDKASEKVLTEPDDTVRLNDLRGTMARQHLAASGAPEGTIRDDAGVAAATLDDDTPRVSGAAALRGTLQGDMLRQTRVESGPFGIPGGGQPAAQVMDKSEQSRQADRLGYVCRLLELAREPYCTLNGVLVVTPFGLLRRGIDQVKHLAGAARQDLRTIQRHARLRCPVISLIGGMEHEGGFGELVRRVGPGPAGEQRIGMGFDPWNPATRDRMEALAVHACDRIEGNVYDLFKLHDGFNKPGNGKLYNLICRTRTGFVELLKAYLAGAFAETEERPMLFAGCYFAATGEIERLKGFLKSVLVDKMLTSQDDLQWTEEAVDSDRSYHNWAAAFTLVSGLLLLGAPFAWYFLR